MINEKFREGTGSNVMDDLTRSETDGAKFSDFFHKLVSMVCSGSLTVDDDFMSSYVFFLINCNRSLENEILRGCVLRYVSLPIWESLSTHKLDAILDMNPTLLLHWKNHSEQSKSSSKKRDTEYLAQWIPKLLTDFVVSVESATLESSTRIRVLYFERFAEFLIDLLSQMTTRRFLNALVNDVHMIVRCHRSVFVSSPDLSGKNKLFCQLLGIIDSYVHFEVDDHSGQALTTEERIGEQNVKLHKLQTVAYNKHKESLKELIFSSTGALGDETNLLKHLELLSIEELCSFAFELGIISTRDLDRLGEPGPSNIDLQEFLLDLFADEFRIRQGQLQSLNQLPLHPNEKLLWDENQIPSGNTYRSDAPLALPKLNLQYLTIHDYLLRNFSVFRLESAFEIREDLTDAIKRMGPRQNLDGSVAFSGWSRMAVGCHAVHVSDVGKPNLGEIIPSHVYGTLDLDISMFTGAIADEWRSLKDHDVVFLVCIEKPNVEASGNQEQYTNERQLMRQGMKPRGSRDMQWQGESADFPKTFGKSLRDHIT